MNTTRTNIVSLHVSYLFLSYRIFTRFYIYPSATHTGIAPLFALINIFLSYLLFSVLANTTRALECGDALVLLVSSTLKKGGVGVYPTCVNSKC